MKISTKLDVLLISIDIKNERKRSHRFMNLFVAIEELFRKQDRFVVYIKYGMHGNNLIAFLANNQFIRWGVLSDRETCQSVTGMVIVPWPSRFIYKSSNALLATTEQVFLKCLLIEEPFLRIQRIWH